MKKTKIRDRKSRINGTRFKVGNQRYLVRVWCGHIQVNLDELFPVINLSVITLFKLKHNIFFSMLNTFLPQQLRQKSPCTSFIQIHNCSANYTYEMVIEPNRIICFSKPVGYVINLKRRKA